MPALLPALFTVLCWSMSTLFSARAGRVYGALRTNRLRLCIALPLLASVGAWRGWPGDEAVLWFMASGLIGLGLGDIAMFVAYRRLGPQLTSLMMQCLAVPGAWLLEWAWLGTRPSLAMVVLSGAILGGVAMAVAPTRSAIAAPALQGIGLLAGFVAAAGNAGGAVLTRRGFTVGTLEGFDRGLVAAMWRVAGALAAMLVLRLLLRDPAPPALDETQRRAGRRALWITALLGPGLGVLCIQWALAEAPAGAVLAVVATVPVMVMPLAWWLDGDRPRPRAVVGGLVAVAAAAWLAWLRQ